MKVSRIAIPLAALVAALAAATVRAENFRCGKWIANEDLSVSELLTRCGEPVSRETRVEDVLSRNFNTGLMYKSGELTIETWTYLRGSGAAPMVVTIVNGKIKSIERRKEP
jgi:hypothetical protein